jgi:hypothetical protein
MRLFVSYIAIHLLLGALFAATPPFAAAAPGAAYADGLTPKKLVLAVGIDRFQDPLWRGLKFPRQDAKSVYDAFMAKDVAFDGGELLADPNGTTTPAVLQALARLAAENRNEEDTVVVYLSTHGTVAYKPDGTLGRYVITSDTDSQRVAATSLDYDRIMGAFQALRSRRKVLILAFCHSGVGKSALTPEMKHALSMIKGPYFDEPLQERSEGSIILTASGWQEPALEDEALGGDVYTHFLLEGFQRAGTGDGTVSITEAHEYAAQRTYEYTHGRQRPSAIVELLGADPILVKGTPQRQRVAMLYSLMRRFAGLNVFVDGEPKGSLEKGVAVPEGRVRLRLEDPATNAVVADRAVTFRSGKEYSVADLLAPRLANTLVAGAAVQGFAGTALRSGYAPRDATGVRLRYLREEALGIFDLGVDGAYFPSAAEQIAVGDGLAAQQTRRSGLLTATAGAREKVGLLSTSRPGLLTEARAGVGPSLLLMAREVDEPALGTRGGRSLSPGLAGTAGLDLTFPYYLLKVGVDATAAAYRGFATEGGPVAWSRLYGVSVGTFW